MRGFNGRVETPFRVRLIVGKRAAEKGYKDGAIELAERHPMDGPSSFYTDAESAGMLAADLRAAVHRLRLRQQPAKPRTTQKGKPE